MHSGNFSIINIKLDVLKTNRKIPMLIMFKLLTVKILRKWNDKCSSVREIPF